MVLVLPSALLAAFLSGITMAALLAECRGSCLALQDFDTVMKALSSNTERWGIFDVTLELKRYLSQAARELN